jgi:hypothetical protein
MRNTVISKIDTYYGPYEVMEEKGKYYLCTPNYDDDYYQEIPYTLYLELLAYEENTEFSGKSSKYR